MTATPTPSPTPWNTPLISLITPSPTVVPTPAVGCLPDDIACAIRDLTVAVKVNNDGQFISTLVATLVGAAAAFLFSWVLARREREKNDRAREGEYERSRKDRRADVELNRKERDEDRQRDRVQRQVERRQARRDLLRERELDRRDAYEQEMAQSWREYILLLSKITQVSRGPRAAPVVEALQELSTQIDIAARDGDAAVFQAMYPRVKEWYGSWSTYNRRRVVKILRLYTTGEMTSSDAVQQLTDDDAFEAWEPYVEDEPVASEDGKSSTVHHID